MKKALQRGIVLCICICSMAITAFAERAHPDTVRTGIYVTSVHNIDFKDMEYTVDFWLWLKYTNRDFDFMQNLEIPQAKTVNKSFSTIDSTNGQYFVQMKI